MEKQWELSSMMLPDEVAQIFCFIIYFDLFIINNNCF